MSDLTAAQIAQLRRMCALASNDTTYTDELLNEYAQRYPLGDAFDLNAIAADVWQERAAAHVGKFSFSADNARYERNQIYEQYMKQARLYRSRRAIRSIALTDGTTSVSSDPLVINGGD
jgi:hypothetical protein